MQAHVTKVLNGVMKEGSKAALSDLLGSRAAAQALSAKMEHGSWHARLGIVLVDDARLRAYSPRAAVEWALRYETGNGLACTRGGTWFSQPDGSGEVEAEAYVSRTAIMGNATPAGADGPWTRAPEDRQVRATASETRALLRAKAEGWTTTDFAATADALRASVLASDAVASSPFKTDSGPDAILASLEKYHAKYDPAEILIQDVVVGAGSDIGLFAARRAVACEKKGSDNFDSDRELVFGEIVKEGEALKLRYARSIFDPEISPRRPTELPAEYPAATNFSNYDA